MRYVLFLVLLGMVTVGCQLQTPMAVEAPESQQVFPDEDDLNNETYNDSESECQAETKQRCDCMLTNIDTSECVGWGPVQYER